MAGVESVHWNGRDAKRLSNSLVEITALTSGGHLADFRFLPQDGVSSQNVFWEAPWPTYDFDKKQFQELSAAYGAGGVGQFLAGYTGHALCLDYFGPPSAEKAAAGLPLHGEAAGTLWKLTIPEDKNSLACEWNVDLPAAQLRFKRSLRLGEEESVAYVEEAVHNERGEDHRFDWVQHATFGPPFLVKGESTLIVSAGRGITSSQGYDGRALFANGREFTWPYVPTQDERNSTIDLRQPFTTGGHGFLATVQLERARNVEHVLAINWRLRLGVGYCFRREDFPWMTIWEENCARQTRPWNGEVQARGMEFGTTPLPIEHAARPYDATLFGTPTSCIIPGHGTKTAKYLIFLFAIPTAMNSIDNLDIKDDAIHLYDEEARQSIAIPAAGCSDFLLKKSGSQI